MSAFIVYFFIMYELPGGSTDIPKPLIAARALLCAALAGGCATPTQNTKSQCAETESDRPDWIGGEKVFEEDEYIYAVGSYGYTKDDEINKESAIGRANMIIAKHLNPGEKIRRIDVGKPKCIETWRNKDGRYYALVRVKK